MGIVIQNSLISLVSMVLNNDNKLLSFFINPEHLEYIVYEILKNSIRFTIQTHDNTRFSGQPSTSSLPDIKVTLADSESRVIIRISDQGGGIDKEAQETIFHFCNKPKNIDSHEPVYSTDQHL